MQYLVDLDLLSFEDLAMPMTEQLELVDHRLYNSLVVAARSAPSTEYIDRITSICHFGCVGDQVPGNATVRHRAGERGASGA